MKQKDIIVIIIVVFFSGLASYFLSKALFSKPQNRNIQVKVVDNINTDFNKPDKNYFNENSVNPTQTIRIGDQQAQTQPKQ